MAVQALYQCLVTPAFAPDEPQDCDSGDGQALEAVPAECAERVRLFLERDAELPDEGHLPAYAKQLLAGAGGQMERIDALLAETSENWSVERMPVVDHAILLLAVYEMLEVAEVPVSVCINEAVELAKVFGGEDESARFVNGLLGRIARTHCADRLSEGNSGAILEEDLMEA